LTTGGVCGTIYETQERNMGTIYTIIIIMFAGLLLLDLIDG